MKQYIEKLKEVLEKDDFAGLDEVLEMSVSGALTPKEIEEIDDILNEATLYAEFKEIEYKEEAISLIKTLI